MDLFGIKMLGFTAENGRKLLISIALVGGLVCANLLVRFPSSCSSTSRTATPRTSRT